MQTHKSEVWPIAKIFPDPGNARRHSEAQIDQIADSMRAFGLVEGLAIRPSGQLIGGEGRWRAMQKLGIEEVDCRVIEGLDEAGYVSLGLALNKLGENSAWDDAALAAAIGQIRAAGADAKIAGFSDIELAQAMGEAPAWPAIKSRMRSTKSLIPAARNSRTHSKDQVDRIAKSMQEYGFTNPILIDEAGGIIAGHGRVMAAQQLGYDQVPVMIAKGWTDAQKRAYLIADNKLALDAGWDEEMLAAEFAALRSEGFDLDLTGFLAGEIDAIENPQKPSAGALADRFGIPPFTILIAREGWWQDRKTAWLALGIESELGRGENLLKFSDTINQPDKAKRARNRSKG